MREVDIVIIGGGSAGMAAAIGAYKQGCRQILIIERDKELGGILLQCIHNGFGLHMFSEELSGPAYAERYLNMIKDAKIEYLTQSMVIHLNRDKIVEYVNPVEGYAKVQAKAVILAMGCRERTRGAIALPGYRPAGIWTAGTAQRYLNMEGYLVGRKIFILGSGDIGLIMARRMTLEGAVVLGVAELMPYSNGLPRNRKQCLEDFNIPLFLSHTIVDIRGKKRIESLVIAQVDQEMKPIPGTEKEFFVDTLLLSVGLIPENTLGMEADIPINPKTRGAFINESYETGVPGIFACGNALHVHDLVDFVSAEGEKAGISAARYIENRDTQTKTEDTDHQFSILPGDGIQYVVPNVVSLDRMPDKIEFLFRVKQEYRDCILKVYGDGKLIRQWKKKHVAPAEMEKIILNQEEMKVVSDELTISLETS